MAEPREVPSGHKNNRYDPTKPQRIKSSAGKNSADNSRLSNASDDTEMKFRTGGGEGALSTWKL